MTIDSALGSFEQLARGAEASEAGAAALWQGVSEYSRMLPLFS